MTEYNKESLVLSSAFWGQTENTSWPQGWRPQSSGISCSLMVKKKKKICFLIARNFKNQQGTFITRWIAPEVGRAPCAFMVTCLVDALRYLIHNSSRCDAGMFGTFPVLATDAPCELWIGHLWIPPFKNALIWSCITSQGPLFHKWARRACIFQWL